MRAMGQAEMLCYVLIYIRFIKDNSLVNAALSVLVVFISQFIQQMVTLYEHRFRMGSEDAEHGEELPIIFKVLIRSIRYFQIAFLLQFVSSMGYHLSFNISEDVCSWKHGYIFTDVIGEFDCGRGGKLFVFALDLVVLLLELLAFDESFTKCVRSPDGILQETNLDGYESHRYGIFSILRFDSYNIRSRELKFTSNRPNMLQAERKNRLDAIKVMADFNKFGRHLMAGKSKKAAKVDEHGTLIVAPPKTASNKEHLQRLNYLFHLSTFHTIANDQDENNALARMYAKNLDLIQKKTKSSLTPGLKRRLCKTCQRTLIPNKTMSPRVINESKRKKPVNRVLVLDCVCGRSKRFPIGKNPSYKAHAEKGSNLTFFQK